MPPQRVLPAASGVAGDDDVDRGIENGLDLELVKGALPYGGQRGRVAVPVAPGQGGDALALSPFGDQDEVPRLGEADRGRLVGGGEHAAEHLVRHRVRQEAPPDVAALTDHPVDGSTLVPGIRLGPDVIIGIPGHRDPPGKPLASAMGRNGRYLDVPLVFDIAFDSLQRGPANGGHEIGVGP